MAEKNKKAIYAAPCEFLGGGFSANGVGLGCKIPIDRCTSASRDEYLVNCNLLVRLSMDTQVGNQPPLPGMENEHPTVEVLVKVTQHSVTRTHVAFRMVMAAVDIEPGFLSMASNSPGSIYILEVKKRKTDEADD
jgi:hypothetical protein